MVHDAFRRWRWLAPLARTDSAGPPYEGPNRATKLGGQTYTAVWSAAVWVSRLSVAAQEASSARACAVDEAGCAE